MNYLESRVLGAVLAGFVSGCDQQSTTPAQVDTHTDLFKLAHLNGCLECHRVDATVVGPSWKAIAARYKDAPLDQTRALLIDRVRRGSQGNWVTWKGGDGMPAMERRVSQQHIEQLVDYILTLRPPSGP